MKTSQFSSDQQTPNKNEMKVRTSLQADADAQSVAVEAKCKIYSWGQRETSEVTFFISGASGTGSTLKNAVEMKKEV